jgi:dihydrofolate reductase
MPKLRLNISMSLDGFVAGPDQSPDNPLGVGGSALHEWAIATRSWRAAHGKDGGETGLDDDRAAAMTRDIGATIMGRNMFGPVRGPWGEEAWNGWWGDDPPFHHPVFVLTHHARDPQQMRGDTTFHFVTDGIESALEQAVAAADGEDVSLAGGGDAARQFLRARLVDEMEIHVVPALLGGGARLFDDVQGGLAGYECVELVSSSRAAHFVYVRQGAR